MVYRIETQRTDTRTLAFSGLMDEAALRRLLARGQAVGATRLLLLRGTEVRRECIGPLTQSGFEIVAESAYLARWLEPGGPGR